MKKITLCLMLILALIIVPGAIFAAEPEAEINGTEYATLIDAIAAVTDDTETTITLLRDVTDGKGFVIPEGRNITIDFDTHTYNVSQYPVGSSGTKTLGCQLLKNSNVTFINGTLSTTCVETSEYKSVKMLIQNYSNLTLKNMTIDATSSKILYGVSINNGEVAITGTTSVKANDGISAIEVCWWASGYPNGAQVTIDTTGTITGNIEYGVIGYNPNEESKTNLTIENVNHVGEIVFNSSEEEEKLENEILVNGGTFSSDITEYEPVAKIGDKTYTTLPKALADVSTNGTQKTITILKDVVDGPGFVVNKGQNVVIDFKGYTYDASNPTVGSNGTKTNGCQLLAGSKVTMRDGTLTSTTAKMLVQNYSDLTLDNMVLDAVTSNASYALSNNNGNTLITGNTTIKSNNVAFDLCWWPKGYPNGANVTVNTTGKIVGDIELGTYDEVSESQKENVLSTLTIKNIVHEGKIVSTEDYLKEQLDITGGTFSSDVKEYISSELNTWVNQDGTVEVVKERNIEMYVVAINGDVQFKDGVYTRENGNAVGRVGEKVYLTVTAEEGYKVVLTIKDAEGNEVDFGEDYSFVMPDSDVSIKAEFVANEATPPTEGEAEQQPEDKPTTGTGEAEKEPETKPTTPDVPKTGDNVVVYAAFAVVAIAGMAVAIKMKRK